MNKLELIRENCRLKYDILYLAEQLTGEKEEYKQLKQLLEDIACFDEKEVLARGRKSKDEIIDTLHKASEEVSDEIKD